MKKLIVILITIIFMMPQEAQCLRPAALKITELSEPVMTQGQLLSELYRMQRMFTAYCDILTRYGKRTSKFVNIAIRKIENKKASPQLIEEALATLRRMPDPHHIVVDRNDKKNWIFWFKITLPDVNSRRMGFLERNRFSIGKGCIFPCRQCLSGNTDSLTRVYPLPYIIESILQGRILFTGATDIFQWRDPFFNVYADGILEFYLRHSGEDKIIFLSRLWDTDDMAGENTAAIISAINRNSPKAKIEIYVSFHLGLSRYDVIKAMYETEDHSIPDKLIEAYAVRYANAIMKLNHPSTVIRVYLPESYYPAICRKPLFWRERELVKDISLIAPEKLELRKATISALERTLRKIGINDLKIEEIISLIENTPGYQVTNLYITIKSPCLDNIVINTFNEKIRGGKDFFGRLRHAKKGETEALCHNNTPTDIKLKGSNIPEVVIYENGDVVVYSVKRGIFARLFRRPKKILFKSTLAALVPAGISLKESNLLAAAA